MLEEFNVTCFKSLLVASYVASGAAAVCLPLGGQPKAEGVVPREAPPVSSHSKTATPDVAPQRANSEDQTQPSPRVTTLLMFYGDAEEAMTLYTSSIPNSKITSIKRYGKGESGAEGSVMHATISLNGQELACIDSIVKHDFTFTPATSLVVKCTSAAELDDLYKKLSNGGQVFMPLQEYPFAKRFVWFTDRFGVSWQLNWSGG
ncbi:MAG: VOC family protein [Phycisphaerae bacterium]|jgi:predicted 3-demethylubiquinone-9 3-methyltransferase (glyoxalase superfamily)